jgi:hypothetical protein
MPGGAVALALMVLTDAQSKADAVRQLERLVALKRDGVLPRDGWENQAVQVVGRHVIEQVLDPARAATLHDGQALKEADAVLAYQPEHVGALLLKAHAHYHRGNLRASRDDLATAARVCKKSDLPQVHLLQGLVYVRDFKNSTAAQLQDANTWLQQLTPTAPSALRAELCAAYAAYADQDTNRRADVLETLKAVLDKAGRNECAALKPTYRELGRRYAAAQVRVALARMDGEDYDGGVKALDKARPYAADTPAGAEVEAVHDFVNAVAAQLGGVPDVSPRPFPRRGR